MRLSLLHAVIGCFLLAEACQALDTVKTATGSVSGHVTNTTPVEITVEKGQRGAVTEAVPVNKVYIIYFEGEPPDLKTAKSQVLANRYAEALADIERIKPDKISEAAAKEAEYYKALCAAKLALAGNGKVSEAGPPLKDFADKNPNSYHYFEASQLVGDLLLAAGQYGAAAQYYARLEKSPWSDYKMRAGIAAGKALLAQGKPEAAQAAFERVLAMSATDSLTRSQQTYAKLGKASALAAQKKTDEAIELVGNVLKTADLEDSPLLAAAYNVLGTAHRQAGQMKEAVYDFLHVDLFYPTVAESHAEALANLAELWEQSHNIERANRARKTLQERYKDSRWAKKLAE